MWSDSAEHVGYAMFDEADEIADDDALELITRLQKRTAEVGAEIGLHQVHFSISPGPPRMAQIVFGLTPEAVETIEQVEAKQIDKEFESLMSGLDLGDEVSEPSEKELEEDRKIEEAQRQIGEWFND